jgi:hypothetical protein
VFVAAVGAIVGAAQVALRATASWEDLELFGAESLKAIA